MLFRSFARASVVIGRESNSRMATVPLAYWSETFDSNTFNKTSGNEPLPKEPKYEFQVGKPNKRGLPPQFGKPDASCHYPCLVVATPTIQNAEGYSCAYVVCRTDSCVFTKDYFVDVPFEVNPGELFRVLIAGEEYIVKCPDIRRPGERIVVTMLAK